MFECDSFFHNLFLLIPLHELVRIVAPLPLDKNGDISLSVVERRLNVCWDDTPIVISKWTCLGVDLCVPR